MSAATREPRAAAAGDRGDGGRVALRVAALRVAALLCLVGLAPALGGCGVGYYWQAGLGQWEIVRQRRPIAEVLHDPQVQEQTKARLRLVLEVQEFGSARLGLDPRGQYRTYTDLRRPQVSWLVVAARPYAFESYRSCFPIVGCFGYRGYFARGGADAFAAELRGGGWDVLVRPVRAYSTLGWFEDPVLNTFLEGDPLALMGTILHELAHHHLYLEGDTVFNESYATVVEEEGVRQFLRERRPAEPGLYRRHEALQADRALFLRIVEGGRQRLEALYRSGIPEPELRAEKARRYAALRADFDSQRASFRIAKYQGWFHQPLNNAHLVEIGQYHQRERAFLGLLRREGGEFPRFLAAVAALAAQPKAARDSALDALAKEPLDRP